MLTDEIKGKPLAELASLGRQDVLDNLGIEISPARLKCAMLSLETLRKGVGDRVAWLPATETEDVPA